ncbi:uncharacterized protein si:dkey-262k9.2 [Hippoglossus stenolepis]|uniref:uncharacterized protein si:dkey-262k9.2 n=1 Tax=Hippoglossus stenolepis TaxID=195615 RepID=UPI001FAE8076|nr:uncharacterized protein si:dkey-262k9.2 [Hippoglossus stenolepis]XP_035019600.2 uncharacterized protein si:dkey-262k9.2 [Hippoglossus stenolepis]XP_035019601.2 uncharacterized protein si:dkey-262k9.2 [Hippoglossus stenolepis]XP_035019602.2 uncharacterized protein si:dkey-262k9.2 [Hippoglossus stenolepis]
MMRLVFLCLLLLLPAASAASEETEGSGDDEMDDEDYTVKKDIHNATFRGTSLLDKTKGEEDKSDQLTMIIIIVAVTVLTLSVATIITVILVRRHLNSRQQGIYSVPAEQEHKGAI